MLSKSSLFISPPFGNYLSLKHCVSIRGSYTSEPDTGKFYQALQTIRYDKEFRGWTNKMGLRNCGIENVIFDDNSITSVAPLKCEDINVFKWVLPRNANIEINISCPNVRKNGIDNIILSCQDLLSLHRKWCIVKISVTHTEKQINTLYNLGFRQFHLYNTVPHNVLGGISGPILKPFVSERICYMKKNYPDTTIIAGGGIQKIEDIIKYKSDGADHFSVSSICFHPLKLTKLYDKFKKLKE